MSRVSRLATGRTRPESPASQVSRVSGLDRSAVDLAQLDTVAKDVVPHGAVIGGGHAGVEAALSVARMGLRAGLLVLDPEAIGRLSCNPAIGGLAKGQLVREVDALGGEMGLATDAAGIQFRMLNTKKGPAVRSPRAQCDRSVYNLYMVERVREQEGLTLIAGEVVDIIVEAARVLGVRLADGRELRAGAVVLTTGTFLGGVLFAGAWERPGGRVDEAAATRLSSSLLELGLRLGRPFDPVPSDPYA